MSFGQEWIDVRDKLPENEKIVLFVVINPITKSPLIKQGCFKKSDIFPGHYCFTEELSQEDHTNGEVFLWSLPPSFSIDSSLYKEFKIDLKYCKAVHGDKIDDRFFKMGKNFATGEQIPQKELEESKERIFSLIPFCECGKKAHFHKTKTVPQTHYHTYQVPCCKECLNIKPTT